MPAASPASHTARVGDALAPLLIQRPANAPEKSSKGTAQVLGPLHNVGDLDEAPGSGFRAAQTWPFGHWGVNQGVGDTSLSHSLMCVCVCVCVTLPFK